MKKFYILASFMVLFSGILQAEDKIDWAKLPAKTVLKAISIFESDPLKSKSDGTLAIIANFADASPNVSVEINTGYLPWFKNEKKVKNADILLMAFIAGNVRSQLIKKDKKDNPVAGMKFMIAIYSKLRKEKKIESIPALEKWVKLDHKGLEKLIPQIKEKDSKE